ncbi:MAG TPA: TetR/AcrR family transcriptional regulator [Solirubrobacteraceae bacterium]|jgi:AcrR family transcriptional regulator|nr:TetR/AcrR family transcriptional regulator [Solirubrobacteraceae bacterium]
MSRLEHGRRGSARRGARESRPSQTIAPIYKRLPKGPHGITATGVAHHQRIRMHGAMIEAIAARGYRNTSVKHVIGLAGVSRRAFYEQFENKEDCFLETFDLIVHRGVKRINHAYRSATGDGEQRTRAAFLAFVEEVRTNSKALHLVVIDAQTAGAGGLRRLRRITATLEGLLSKSFVDRRELEALPLPVVRAMVGGLRRATFVRVRDGGVEDCAELGEEMLRWSLLFRSPAVAELRPRACSNAPFLQPVALEPATGAEGERARVVRAAIDLTLRGCFEDLSALRIADEAGLSIETFLGLFADKEACFLGALDMLGDDVLQLVANPGLVSAEWARAVCETIESLLAYLASRPALAITLTTKALEAGPRAVQNTMDLAHELATLLTEGAPRRAPGALAVEGVAGALWHTLSSEIVAGRGHRLPILAEYLSYAVLTPFIGPEEAVRAIVTSRAAAPAATPEAALAEVREQGADEHGDRDHDDQRGASGAEDPIDLDGFEVEDGEQRGEHGEQDEAAGARELAAAALGLGLGLGAGGVVEDGGHATLDASPTRGASR